MIRKITFLVAFTVTQFVTGQISTDKIDWENFLSPHDFVWYSIPTDYYSGAIMGNGLLGLNIYANEDKTNYSFHIGRSDVNERREGGSTLYHRARLPIGHFELHPVNPILENSDEEQMRLSLYNAQTSIEINTANGSTAVQAFVDANQNVIVIEAYPSIPEKDFRWEWKPGKAISPRTEFAYTRQSTPKDYLEQPNPDPVMRKTGDIEICIQELYSGYTYVTAWKEIKSDEARRFLITVSFEKGTEQAIRSASDCLNDYQKQPFLIAKKKHQEWWNNYYPASFAHFPDKIFESFYWIQQYKFACLTRADKNIIDLMGPWTAPTPWPAIWWNLNIQLTYSPLFCANRLELSEPLWRSLNENVATLSANVTVEEWRSDAIAIGRSSSYDLKSTLRRDLAKENQYEVGNLTWLLYYYWQYCMYKNDNVELTERFYPLLRKSIAYYTHIIYKGEDGKYHLPLTASPEYKPAEDCNYDLAIFRWGLQTLTDINKKFSLGDNRHEVWTDILANLTPFPEDKEEGFLIGRDVNLSSSHRHYSHLLMIYPFRQVTPEHATDRERIIRSINHWIGQKGALQGYSYTGSSSISSILGNGDDAYRYLKDLLDKYVEPNTLYRETGPVIETPLSAVTSMQEMYLQSHNDVIEIFPAIPGHWKEASFIDFRAEKGILVSAQLKEGKTCLLQLKSPVSTVCRIYADFGTNNINIQSIIDNKKQGKKIPAKDGYLELFIHKGETVLITSPSYTTKDILYEVSSGEKFHYGLMKKTN